LAGTASLALFILLNVWTWPFVPVLVTLSRISIFAGAGIASTASAAAWFFSAPWLRVVVATSLLPSLVIVVASGMTLIGFPFRHRILKIVSGEIRRGIGSPRGFFPFLSSTSATIAIILTSFATCLSWIASLSLKIGTPTLMGVNSLILSLIACVIMFLIVLQRGRNPENGSVAEPVMLFFIGTSIVVVGFYIQAILECFIPTQSAAGVGNGTAMLVRPALDALLPGSVIGCTIVCSLCAGRGWVRISLRIWVILAIWDAWVCFLSPMPYRDLLFSVGCDAFGAPFAALLTLLSRRWLFNKRSLQ